MQTFNSDATVDMQAIELDAAFLAIVRAWARDPQSDTLDEAAFDRHARAVFAYQIERNEPYARFAASLGFTRERLPQSRREIPAVPSSAFKDATLATFDVRRAELAFHTSGTTGAQAGWHYLERAALYDASLIAGFDRFLLPDGIRPRFLNLVPNPRRNPHSSLGYMMGHLSVLRGDGKAGWFLEENGPNVDAFVAAMRAAIAENRPVCVAGTAFAFVVLLDALDERNIKLAAPLGSRVMETGGFKGRSRAVTREELYARISTRLGVPQNAIISEYGMTELLSQYYDDVNAGETPRVKRAAPWLRTLVVDAEGREMSRGEIGFLRHFDLGNRSSVLAIETEDRGYLTEDGGLVLLGRQADAPPRGCSLDAEEMLRR